MARTSSTSSSEHEHLPDGKPIALFLAILLILFVELLVRLLGHDRMLPYWESRFQYESAALHLRYGGALADVCFIGSSRAREGIHMPTILATLDSELERPVTGSNFACPAVLASDMVTFVRAILRQGSPKMIVYVISPRALLELNIPTDTTALFLDLKDIGSDDPTVRQAARHDWPVLVRSELGRSYRTLAYRRRVSVALHRSMATLRGDDLGQDFMSLLTFAPIPSPITGDESIWHTRDRGLSLATRPVSDERVKVYVERLLNDGRYRLSPAKLRAVSEIISMCKDHDVPLVLVEIPVADLLLRHWPPGTRAEFLDSMNEIADDMRVPFITFDQLDVDLRDEDYLEQSHLSRVGAVKFSEALAKDVLAPRLSEDDAFGRSSKRDN